MTITSDDGSIVWRALLEPALTNIRALVGSSRDKVRMVDRPGQVPESLDAPMSKRLAMIRALA